MPDLPGHGESLVAQEYGTEATVAALMADLDELSITRTDLLGYSLGGRLALYLAFTDPDRVGRLVLESTTAGLDDEAERRARRIWDARWAAVLRTDGVAAFVDAWYRQPLFASLRRRPDLLEDLEARRRLNDAEGLARSLEGIGAGVFPSLWHRLQEMDIPVMLINGSLDDRYCALASRLESGLSHVRHVEVAEAGHNTHLENPRVFASAVREYLLGSVG